MLPYIGNTIPSYSVLAIIGLFSMMLLIYLRNKILTFYEYFILIIFMIIGAALGSKFVFVVTQIPDIIAHFSIKYMIYKIITSGFVFYGGLFGAIAGCVMFSKLKSYDVKVMLNLVTPGYSMFHAFGRIGCFLAGCCYGKQASWGVAMNNESEVLRIPVQLIESVFLFLLTWILIQQEKKNRNIFILYLVCYAFFRFIIEFYRGDIVRGMWGCFSTSQWVSLLIVLLLIVYKTRQWHLQ